MTGPGLIELTDRIFIVDSPTGGKFPMAYGFLILGKDTRALIDTGCGPAACRQVIDRFGVDLVINSHCHPDHVSGNHLFAEKPLWVPRERHGETGAVATLSRRLVGPDPDIMAFWEDWVRSRLLLDDYEPTGTFGDGHVFDFGGVRLEALHTPGHLDDHYCFLEPDARILFSFDVDLTTFGPFYGNPEADIPLLAASMDRLTAIEPACVASSHRLPVTENIREALQDFKGKIKRNQRRVAGALDRPRTLAEICALKPIFGKYIPGVETIYAFFERCMIQKHLDLMASAGRVRMDGDRYILSE